MECFLCFFNHFSTRITFFWFLRKAKSPAHTSESNIYGRHGGLCGPWWGLRNSTCSVPWRSNFSRLSSSTVNWSVSFAVGLWWFFWRGTLQGTNISPKNGILKMIFLFPRWDMLIPWRVISGLAALYWLPFSPKNFGGNIDEIPPFFVGIYRKTGDPECAGECLLEPSLMSIVELVELL